MSLLTTCPDAFEILRDEEEEFIDLSGTAIKESDLKKIADILFERKSILNAMYLNSNNLKDNCAPLLAQMRCHSLDLVDNEFHSDSLIHFENSPFINVFDLSMNFIKNAKSNEIWNVWKRSGMLLLFRRKSF